MFHRHINLETYCDIHEDMLIASATDTGSFLTITGEHPTLGHVVIVQGIMSTDVLLISEFPASLGAQGRPLAAILPFPGAGQRREANGASGRS